MAPAPPAYGALAHPSPKGVRAAVGRILRIGVLASATLILTGYLVGIVADPSMFGSAAVERAHLAGRSRFPHSFAALSSALSRGNGEAIIVAGVLLLILTPMAGLLTSAVAFWRRRDWMFAGISLTVLTIIVGSFVIGWLTA